MGDAPPGDLVNELARLAAAYGVATEYEDQRQERVEVPADSVRRVLTVLGVDPEGPPPRASGGLPPTVVVTVGRVPALPDQPATVTLEDGGRVETSTGRLGELPLGWHRLVAGGQAATLVVAPALAPIPAPSWGWMVQLYALRSARSWGIGDLADLADLARWSGSELGAGLVLVNPLHAVAPVRPIQASPYYPTSRRFTNPIYLRVEAIDAYAAAPAHVRRRADELGAPLRADVRGERIERDAVWTAKLAALELLWQGLADHQPPPPGALRDFATWCALAEQHGPDWRVWPAGMRDPGTASAPPDRVAFHAWLQGCCDAQLAAAQLAAADAGMPIGVVHDLAVGVDPGGADAWALQDVLASGARVGVPPDTYNQRGQDWALPPWHPQRLAAAGYAPYRDLLRSIFRHGGGVRIDHILGLFRLWWIPDGSTADRGSYVSYDAAALLGILALEAHRAGAVVVGEDLGTVERRVQRTLADRGVLGCSVLWFERDEDTDELRAPDDWRELAMASISTHDLPTAAGFLAGEHVRVRHDLGQLVAPVAAERRQARQQRAEILDLLSSRGWDTVDPLLGLHQLLGQSPARLRVAQPSDAVGDLRQPNLPGTVDEYPNWRLPLADPEGRPLTLEDLYRHPRIPGIAAALGRRSPTHREGNS